MSHIFGYLKHNALAAIALFVALGGTGYAATQVPANSVGSVQIEKRSVTPDKLSANVGLVRAWAYSASDGHTISSRGIKAERAGEGDTFFKFALRVPNLRGCAATASVASTPTGTVPGSAIAETDGRTKQVGVSTFNAAGQPAPLPFVVEVLC